MTRSLLRRLSGRFRDRHVEPPVHFHSGPDSTPAVCHDARCTIPRLDV